MYIMKAIHVTCLKLTFQQTVGFLLRGAGGSTTNDHDFPFSSDVEFVERSLRASCHTKYVPFYRENLKLKPSPGTHLNRAVPRGQL